MDKYQLCFLGSLLIASESLSVDPPGAPAIVFVDDEVEWTEARERCKAEGGWLWAPKNQDELAKTGVQLETYWTGWRRVTDQSGFTDTQDNQLSIDSKAWQPNQQDEEEDAICVESSKFKLNGVECDKELTFYCEFPNLTRKREWVDKEETWNDAKTFCRLAKGWLWAPKTLEELRLATTDRFWTGWNDQYTEMIFNDTLNENTLSSKGPMWHDGEPNDDDTDGEDCVESKDMELNDENCASERKFYCEFPLTTIATSKGNHKTPTSTTTRPNNATPTTTVPKKDKHSGGNQGGAKVEAEVTEATATQVRATLLTAAGVLVFASAL